MNIGIITCPNCKMRVAPKLDGTCPSCQSVISSEKNTIRRKNITSRLTKKSKSKVISSSNSEVSTSRSPIVEKPSTQITFNEASLNQHPERLFNPSPTIQRLVQLLSSDNSSKRYDACELLRVSSQPLPQVAIDALKSATYDPSPDVADAARRALAGHSVPTTQVQKQPSPSISVQTSFSTFAQPHNILSEPNYLEYIMRESLAKKHKNRMMRGLLFVVLGIIFTVSSYSDASVFGGSYYICWGAILYGLIDFFGGLIGWLKFK